jgi:type III secretion protein Q
MMAAAERLRMRRCAWRAVPADAALLRRRIGRGLSWPFGGAPQAPWRCLQLRLAQGAPLQPPQRSLALRLCHGVVHGPADFISLASGVALGSLDAAADALREATLKLAFACIDMQVVQALGGAVEAAAAADAAAAEVLQPLLATLVSGNGIEQHSFTIWADARTALAWTAERGWAPLQPPPPWPGAAALAFRAAIEVCELHLGARELRRLRRGDALLLPRSAEQALDCRARLGSLELNLQRQPDGALACIDVRRMSLSQTPSPTAPPADAADAQPAALHSLDDLPVTLTILVGSLELTLAQLRELAPGSVLQLPRAADARVQVLANHRPVGSGELVDVDGQLAVELIEWSGAS